jgi:hypothetical protein
MYQGFNRDTKFAVTSRKLDKSYTNSPHSENTVNQPISHEIGFLPPFQSRWDSPMVDWAVINVI